MKKKILASFSMLLTVLYSMTTIEANTGLVATGDATDMTIYYVLFGVALLGIILVFIMKKKKK